MSELKVTTFSSKGRVTRINGIKTGKIHHLQSDNQLRAFLILEWSDSVVDIKEGVRLENLLEEINDVENLRLDKFIDKSSGKTYDLFTNFLVTVRYGDKEVINAIAIKNSSELKRKSTIEKIEIERRYWKSKSIEFYLITEKEIDKTLVSNIQWVRDTVLLDSVEDRDIKSNKLFNYLMINKENNIDELLDSYERNSELIQGEAMYLFRYLIAKKVLLVDMKKKINISIKVCDLIS